MNPLAVRIQRDRRRSSVAVEGDRTPALLEEADAPGGRSSHVRLRLDSVSAPIASFWLRPIGLDRDARAFAAGSRRSASCRDGESSVRCRQNSRSAFFICDPAAPPDARRTVSGCYSSIATGAPDRMTLSPAIARRLTRRRSAARRSNTPQARLVWHCNALPCHLSAIARHPAAGLLSAGSRRSDFARRPPRCADGTACSQDYFALDLAARIEISLASDERHRMSSPASARPRSAARARLRVARVDTLSSSRSSRTSPRVPGRGARLPLRGHPVPRRPSGGAGE